MKERLPKNDVRDRDSLVRATLPCAVCALAALVLTAPPAHRAPRPIPTLRVDPNTAPAGVLLALPGLSRTRVAALMAARRAGPFRSADDLERRVRGIGPASIAVLRPNLRFPDGPEIHVAEAE
jgi:competence protein ComEA